MCLAIKECCIFDVLSPSVGGNNRVWNLRFYRKFNDWELASSFSFFHLIQSRIPRGGGCDSLCWSFNGSGKFDIEIRDVTPIFPWKGICKVKVTKRVALYNVYLSFFVSVCSLFIIVNSIYLFIFSLLIIFPYYLSTGKKKCLERVQTD